MTFDEILAQIIDLLKRQGRVPYTYCIFRCNFRGGIHLRVR